MIRKILSTLLVFVLIFTLVPIVPGVSFEAYAASATVTANFINDPNAAKATMGNGVSWSGDAANGYTLELSGVNFTTTAPLAVVLPANTTLVLKGTNTITSTCTSGDPSRAIQARDLTIKEKDGFTGNLTVKGGTAAFDGDTYGIYTYNGLSIESGTINAYGGTANRGHSAGIGSGSSVTISGGTVNAIGGTADGYNQNNGTGGMSCGIETSYFNITGGTVNVTAGHAANNSLALYATSDFQGNQINGGTVTLTSNNTWRSENQSGVAYTSCGIFSTSALGIYAGKITIKKATGSNGEGAGIEIYKKGKLSLQGGLISINSYNVAIKGRYSATSAADAFDFSVELKNSTSEKDTLGGTCHIRIKPKDPSLPVVFDDPDCGQEQIAPLAGEGYTINYETERIYSKSGYELRHNGRSYSSLSVSDLTGQTIWIRKAKVPYQYLVSETTPIKIPERPVAPTGLTPSDETIKGKYDGSVSGVTTAMKYYNSMSGVNTEVSINADGILYNLKPGTYVFRYKSTENKFASNPANIVIGEGGTLTVTFNANGGSNVAPVEGLSWHDTLDVPVSDRKNYVLVGWYPNENLTGEKLTEETQIESNCTYFAKWKKDADTASVKAELNSVYNTVGLIPVTVDLFEGLPADIANPVLGESVTELSDTDSIIKTLAGTGYILAENLSSDDIGKYATWKVVISSDNYGDITAEVKVTIADKNPLNVEIKTSGYEYNKEPQKAVITSDLVEGTDYTVSYTVSGNAGSLSESGIPVGAGTYTVTVTGIGEYSGSETTGTMEIAKIAVKAPGAALAPSYNSKPHTAVFQKYDETIMRPVESSTSILTATETGLYDVEFELLDSDNYEWLENGNKTAWRIISRNIKITPNQGQSKVYGKTDPAKYTFTLSLYETLDPELTASLINEYNTNFGDKVTLKRKAGEYAGQYELSLYSYAASSNNFSEKPGDKAYFTILPADQTLTLKDFTVSDLTAEAGKTLDLTGYASSDAENAKVEYTVKSGNATINGNNFIGSEEGSVVVAVNSAAVDLGGSTDPEYKAAEEKTFTVTVTKAQGSDTGENIALQDIKLEDIEYVYNGAPQTAVIKTKLAEGMDYTVSYAVSGTHGSLSDNGIPVGAGIYEVMVTGKGAYTDSANLGTMEIAKKKVSIPNVKGTYKFDYTTIHTVQFENYNISVMEPFEYDFSTVSTNLGGEHRVEFRLLDSDNYEWDGKNWTMWTVDGVETVIIPDAGQSKVYGEADPEEFSFTTSLTGELAGHYDRLMSQGVKIIRTSGEFTGDYEFNLATVWSSDSFLQKLQRGVYFTILPAEQHLTLKNFTGSDLTVEAGKTLNLSGYASSDVENAAVVYTVKSGEGEITGTTFKGLKEGQVVVAVNSAGVDLGGSTDPEYKAAEEKTFTITVTKAQDSGNDEGGNNGGNTGGNGGGGNTSGGISGGSFGEYVPIVPEPEVSVDEDTEAEILQGQLDKVKLVARSKMSRLHGKPSVRVRWFDLYGNDLDFDGYEVFRSVKRYKGYGKKPFFETKKEFYHNTLIESGNTYYYKVRGYIELNDKKYYTDWSNKAWRTVK